MFLGEIPWTSARKFWWPGKPSYWSVLRLIFERHWKRGWVESVEEKAVGRVGEVDIPREVEVFTRRR
jgi:hypothetical protein